MKIDEAQQRVCDRIREVVTGRAGENRYTAIMRGHLLVLTESWFGSILFPDPKTASRGRKGRSDPASSTPHTPLSSLEQIADLARAFTARPALHVESGLGALTACLRYDLGIDRDPARIAMARSIFPDGRYEVNGLEGLDPEAVWGTILCVNALGRAAARERQAPVFQGFVEEADRRLRTGGRLIVADRDQYQDNLIEPLVAREYEILEVLPVKGAGLTVVVTEK